MPRQLTADEIRILENSGCTAADWSLVEVSDEFSPFCLRNVTFSGHVVLGGQNGTFLLPGGIERRSAIRDVTLHEVTVGKDVYINGVAGYIANYDIDDGVFIENVESIRATLDSAFGVATPVSVLNETGGREVAIYENLSAQTAYLAAMYRNRPLTAGRLAEMAGERAARLRGCRGRIGRDAVIVNAGEISNVMIGEFARIDGASRLSDGTITGSETDPARVGRGVIAEGFILASGARVEDGAVVSHCFVGQASHLTRLFSAHDSLFFSNCACENGEAAAIFAGPYTVTMHKSSLLIAGMFSFLNAGSGSNQSNHMYKLGPIHQGVVERGSKTTSDSYILWPARIGAFSLVMGRHVNHPDTSDLPFSYLIESHNDSYLVPGINLRSVGTIRDAQKWPRRDKRRDSRLLDCINFNLLSPFTAGKMFNGIDRLNRLEETSGRTADRYAFQSMIIEAHALRKGRSLYETALNKFMGNSLINRLGSEPVGSDAELRERLAPTHPAGCGQWVDVCGMLAPKSEVERVCDAIESGAISSLDELEAEWHRIHADYYDMEWTWVADNMERWCGKTADSLSAADVRRLVDRWLGSVTALNGMLLEDARKEFSPTSQTGFGIDNPDADAGLDFTSVRGEYDKDPFVRMVIDHNRTKSALASATIALLPAG